MLLKSTSPPGSFLTWPEALEINSYTAMLLLLLLLHACILMATYTAFGEEGEGRRQLLGD